MRYPVDRPLITLSQIETHGVEFTMRLREAVEAFQLSASDQEYVDRSLALVDTLLPGTENENGYIYRKRYLFLSVLEGVFSRLALSESKALGSKHHIFVLIVEDAEFGLYVVTDPKESPLMNSLIGTLETIEPQTEGTTHA